MYVIKCVLSLYGIDNYVAWLTFHLLSYKILNLGSQRIWFLFSFFYFF